MKLEGADSDIISFLEEEKQRTSVLTKNKDGSLVSRVLPIRRKISAPSSPRRTSSDGTNSAEKENNLSIQLSPLSSPRERSQSTVPYRKPSIATISTSAASFSAKSLSESHSSSPVNTTPAKKPRDSKSSDDENSPVFSNNRNILVDKEEEEEKIEKLRRQLKSPSPSSSDERTRQIDDMIDGVREKGSVIPPPPLSNLHTGLYSTASQMNNNTVSRKQSLSDIQSPSLKFANLNERVKKLEMSIQGHTARVTNEIVKLQSIIEKEKRKSVCCFCCDWIASVIDSDEDEEDEYTENGLGQPFLVSFQERSL